MDQGQPQAQAGVSTGLHETAQTARDLAHTLEHSADTLETASRTVEAVSQKVDRVTGFAERARDTVTANAREHPIAALATAFTIGFAVGRLGD